MSTIVVVRKRNSIAIGADTMSSQGSVKIHRKYQRNSGKIHKIKQSYFGVVGSSATSDVLKSIGAKHRNILNLDGKMNIFETLLELQPILRDDYFVNPAEDDDTQEYDSNQIHALIANKSGAFEIQSYREVHEIERFWAIGSGKRLALGAMHAVFDSEKDPKKIAAKGLAAACEFDDGSGLPFVIKTISTTGK